MLKMNPGGVTNKENLSETAPAEFGPATPITPLMTIHATKDRKQVMRSHNGEVYVCCHSFSLDYDFGSWISGPSYGLSSRSAEGGS